MRALDEESMKESILLDSETYRVQALREESMEKLIFSYGLWGEESIKESILLDLEIYGL